MVEAVAKADVAVATAASMGDEVVTEAVAKADVAVATAASTGDEAATKTTSTPDESATKTVATACRGRRDRGHGVIHEGRGRDEERVHGGWQSRPGPVSTVAAAMARATRTAASLAVVKHRFVIFDQEAKRAVKLDWLIIANIIDCDSTTRIEHCGQKIHTWTSCVRTLGEPGTMGHHTKNRLLLCGLI